MFFHEECCFQGVEGISSTSCGGGVLMFLPGFCPINFACPLPDFFTRMTSRTDPSIPVPLACEHACFGTVAASTAHGETPAC